MARVTERIDGGSTSAIKSVVATAAGFLLINLPVVIAAPAVRAWWPSSAALRAAVGFSAPPRVYTLPAIFGAVVVANALLWVVSQIRSDRPRLSVLARPSVVVPRTPRQAAMTIILLPALLLMWATAAPLLAAVLVIVDRPPERLTTALAAIGTVAGALAWAWFALFAESLIPVATVAGASALFVLPQAAFAAYLVERWWWGAERTIDRPNGTGTDSAQSLGRRARDALRPPDPQQGGRTDAHDEGPPSESSSNKSDRQTKIETWLDAYIAGSDHIQMTAETFVKNPAPLEDRAPADQEFDLDADVVRPLIREYNPDAVGPPLSADGIDHLLDLVAIKTPISLEGLDHDELSDHIRTTMAGEGLGLGRYELDIIVFVRQFCEAVRRQEIGLDVAKSDAAAAIEADIGDDGTASSETIEGEGMPESVERWLAAYLTGSDQVPGATTLIDNAVVFRRCVPDPESTDIENDIVRPVISAYDPVVDGSPTSPDGVERIIELLETETPVELSDYETDRLARTTAIDASSINFERPELELIVCLDELTGRLAEQVREQKVDASAEPLATANIDEVTMESESDVPRPHPSQAPEKIPGAPRCDLSYEALEPEQRLGSGGAAVVHLATTPTRERPSMSAIKEPKVPDTLNDSQIELFREEAEKWAKLDDIDHVVDVIDWGLDPHPWIALEYMDGGDLGAIAGDISLVRALWTAYCIADGLHWIHLNGVVHRDLKPANVLLRAPESGERWSVPKISDLGQARWTLNAAEEDGWATRTYAAPEQLAPDLPNKERLHKVDIYSFGELCYELFTGAHPYNGTNDEANLRDAKTSEPVPDPRLNNPDLPESVASIITKAMAIDPANRYETMQSFRYALAVELASRIK